MKGAILRVVDAAKRLGRTVRLVGVRAGIPKNLPVRFLEFSLAWLSPGKCLPGLNSIFVFFSRTHRGTNHRNINKASEGSSRQLFLSRLYGELRHHMTSGDRAWTGVLRPAVEYLEPRYVLTPFTELAVNLGAANGVAWGDFNNDGWSDLYTSWNDGVQDFSSIVLRNNDGVLSMQQQLLSNGNLAGPGVWGDYNNDGFLDIFTFGTYALFRNDAGTSFTDVSHLLPSLPMVNTQGATWGDFNGDSYLDLYVGAHENPNYEPDVMLLNHEGNGFTIAFQEASGISPGRGTTAADFDEDGDLDVYVSNYRLEPNDLWENDGLGNFSNGAFDKGVAGDAGGDYSYGHTIGSAWGDMDNDGHFDLFVGNFRHPWGDGSQDYSKFLRNRGPTHGYDFELRNELDGGDWQEGYAAPAFGDHDNDGDLDFFFTAAPPNPGDRGRLYRNDGNWQFTNDTSNSGDLASVGNSYQNGWGDLDNDGDLDLVTGARIFRNDSSNNNNWVKVKLVGDGEQVNTTAIGAQVRASYGGAMASRQVEGGTGQGSQNDLTLHFGLGNYSGNVSLEITWPDGTVRNVNVTANQYHTILMNEGPSVPTDLVANQLGTTSANLSWTESSDPNGDTLIYEVQYRKDDLSDSWSNTISYSLPAQPLVVPVAATASTGSQSGLWGIENIIIEQPSTFDVSNGTSGNPDHDADPDNDTGLGLIGYTGGVRMSSVAVPENSAGIPSSPLLYNFQDPSQAYYTGHVERKPYSMWLGGVGQVNDQWIEIELAEVTELEQLWIWNWNDLPEVGRQANSFEIQVSTVTTTPGQLGNVTWDTTFANDFSETTGGGVPDRPVDFVQTFPEGTFSRYIRINDIDHLGPASGGNNYLGLGPVFVFEASAGPLLELTGLEPDTTFRARIRANDGDMTSNWLEVDKFFTTLPASSESPIGEVGQITHLTHQTQTVMLSRTYNTPVVFAQSPSDNGKTAIVVRVKDVLSDRFSVFLEEPSNEDGIHAAETITYVVLESGEHSLLDGTRLEVGTVLTNATVGKLVPSQWETVSFATSFPDTPVLLSQIQTNAGIDYLQVRQNQITLSGADLALEQQENISIPHPTTERIGYLAIEQGVSRWNGLPFEANTTAMAVTEADYSQSFLGNYASPPRLLSSLSSYGGKDSAHVRYKTLSASGVAFRVGEDQTADAERFHGAETVAYLAIGGTGTLTAALPQVTIGETGKIANLTHVEQTVILENSYSNPVVFAQSLSYNGTDPALVRVKNVQSDRFTAYITEPSNENGMHGVGEEMSYVVLESGKHTLSDGRRLEVGRVTTAATVGPLLNNQWETVGFSTNFSVAPAVFSQIQTAVGEAYLQTRQSNVTASAVDIALEQEEAATGVHGSETIGYLAVESGSGAWNHLLFEVSHTANVVSDQWFDQDFGVAFGKAPNLLSSLTTYSDADAAHVRYGSLDRNSVRLRVEEDTSTDTEVVHGGETIAYLAIGGSGSLGVAPSENPPQVVQVVRNGGQQTYQTLEKLTFTFDQDVLVDVSDLTLHHASTAEMPVDLQGVGFVYDSQMHEATWDFSVITDLQIGFYSAVLDGNGISTASGSLLDGDGNDVGGDDHTYSLLIARMGDTDLDGDVDIGDFNITAVRFDPLGQNAVHSWSQGNFDGDEDVDITDVNRVIRNFSPLGYGALSTPLVANHEVASFSTPAIARGSSFSEDAISATLEAVELSVEAFVEPSSDAYPRKTESSELWVLDIAQQSRQRYHANYVSELAFANFDD